MIIRTEAELAQVEDALRKTMDFALDTETVDEGYPDIHLVGVSLSWGKDIGCYIPVGHSTGEMQLPQETLVEMLKPILESGKVKLRMQNTQYDAKVLYTLGIDILETLDPTKQLLDTLIMDWMLATDEDHDLATMAKKHLGITLRDLNDMAKKGPGLKKLPNGQLLNRSGVLRVDRVPIAELGDYAWADAVVTYRLADLLLPRVYEEGWKRIYHEVMMPLLFVLTEMELVGTRVLKEKLEQFGAAIEEEMKKAEEAAYACRPSGEPFNLNSQKQLNEVLFQEMGIKPYGDPNPKTGLYSTAADYMDRWAEKHEICRHIQRYKELSKLYGTYIKGMGEKIKEDGRLHTRFRMVRTGRLGSRDPNLQNIPNNREFPIKQAFVPTDERYAMAVFDFSQIELRMIAHRSKDPTLIKAYQEGRDIHSETAKICWKLDCPVEEVKEKYPEIRDAAKVVNFGLPYGLGVRSLMQGINKTMRALGKPEVTEKEAAEIADNYFQRFRNVKDFIAWSREFGQKNGFVRTLLGRKRHLPDIRSKNKKLQAVALNGTVNSQIQGSAADVMNVAMVKIWNKVRREKGWTREQFRILLQVHDEIVFECHKELMDEAFALVKHEMENAISGLRVPIVAEGAIVESWDGGK